MTVGTAIFTMKNPECCLGFLQIIHCQQISPKRRVEGQVQIWTADYGRSLVLTGPSTRSANLSDIS